LISPVIEFRGATKIYARGKRIGPVDLSVNRGEIMGFLGPNGSGKTTCIRMLLGLAKPSSGNVRLRGIDPVAKHVRALTGVGYSAELPNIQTFLTPRQVMELTASELGMNKGSASKELEGILEEVGIIEYADVKVGRLSKGMVQRLSVAQAMLGSPEVMVMDEPMIGLDPVGTAHLREVFKNYALEGGTILMSSHMMSEVEDICSSIVLIHGGRLLFKGTPKEMVGQMLGADEVKVEVKAMSPAVVDAIRMLEGIIDVETIDGGLKVRIRHDVEVRPTIAKIITDSGSQLLAMARGERLLERAYIEALRNSGSKT
jgi:ABC-2 type transport system ATP-binding protein